MCSAPSSAASSSTMAKMTVTTLLSSAVPPTASVPASTPPQRSACPSAQNRLTNPADRSYVPLHSSRWHSVPTSSGSTATHTVRRITGRPLCPSWIQAMTASAGAVR